MYSLLGCWLSFECLIAHGLLDRIASYIIKKCRSVNRVKFNITSKPPRTIEWEWGGATFKRSVVAP